MEKEEHHYTSAGHPDSVDSAISHSQALEALRDGPRGALVIAAVAVALLFAGWLLFYFVLFLSRGTVG
jgi:hypothetical protein